ncbi:MAG: FecR domain-containing protein, partial [Proteobacteria bacterium]|nr:FecR domain-containing protein [Pseudomonadota bacterium]
MNGADRGPGRNAAEGDDLRRLIAGAGRRPDPRPAIEDTVRAAVHREWRSAVADRRHAQLRRRLVAASLATVAVAATWSAYWLVRAPAASAMATVVQSQGEVSARSGARSLPIAAGARLTPGTDVHTEPTANLWLTVGPDSIRIAGGTQVVLDAPNRIRLERGRVYVDAVSPGGTAGTLAIATPVGEVRHVGTRFQVEVGPDGSLGVFVRDGRV